MILAANTFGTLFRVTTFGESHGEAMGVVVDGCPSGVLWNQELLLTQLRRRRPGHSSITSDRKESDLPRVLSGVFEEKTLGTPIAIMVENADARSGDYESIKIQSRQGHADDVWKQKFGHSDHRGGGRASGRETVARVMAGAVAQMFVASMVPKISVEAFAVQIGPLTLGRENQYPPQLEELLLQAKADGKSYGGIVELQINNCPIGLGQPVFHKFKADLASAIMGVGATAGFEIGDGISSVDTEGSEFHRQGHAPYGGIRGGITTGETVVLRCFFKPTSSVLDIAKQGRHDPCIVPRALPVLEAMVWITLADHILWKRLDQA